ncbi:hypothetical protein KPN3_22 [Klebsiella phage KPN3]|uniref:Uncharacterized protein n=1 Tax=Klebsiella phage KPN3 TaxID=2601621 RepID=A0A5B9NFH8_9CAUD|nr:hypothetical protein KPN3_22 [Klebsiella phage KPN3]
MVKSMEVLTLMVQLQGEQRIASLTLVKFRAFVRHMVSLVEQRSAQSITWTDLPDSLGFKQASTPADSNSVVWHTSCLSTTTGHMRMSFSTVISTQSTKRRLSCQHVITPRHSSTVSSMVLETKRLDRLWEQVRSAERNSRRNSLRTPQQSQRCVKESSRPSSSHPDGLPESRKSSGNDAGLRDWMEERYTFGHHMPRSTRCFSQRVRSFVSCGLLRLKSCFSRLA